MKFPQLLVLGLDDWIAGQLGDLARESRWLLRELRHPDAVLRAMVPGCPTVVLVQADPADPRGERWELLEALHRTAPDVACVVLSDAKLPDERRAAWAAFALDLGARWVLFPPYTRLVLEDLAGALMQATARRVVGEPAPGAKAAPLPVPPPADDAPIDLAAGDYEA